MPRDVSRQARWPARTPASLGGQWRPEGLPDWAEALFLGVAALVDGAGGGNTVRERRRMLVRQANSEAATVDWGSLSEIQSKAKMRDILNRRVLGPTTSRGDSARITTPQVETDLIASGQRVRRDVDSGPQTTGAVASRVARPELSASPVRSAAGRVRNLRQMSDDKLGTLVSQMSGGTWRDRDPDGLQALKTELDRRLGEGVNPTYQRWRDRLEGSPSLDPDSAQGRRLAADPGPSAGAFDTPGALEIDQRRRRLAITGSEDPTDPEALARIADERGHVQLDHLLPEGWSGVLNGADDEYSAFEEDSDPNRSATFTAPDGWSSGSIPYEQEHDMRNLPRDIEDAIEEHRAANDVGSPPDEPVDDSTSAFLTGGRSWDELPALQQEALTRLQDDIEAGNVSPRTSFLDITPAELVEEYALTSNPETNPAAPIDPAIHGRALDFAGLQDNNALVEITLTSGYQTHGNVVDTNATGFELEDAGGRTQWYDYANVTDWEEIESDAELNEGEDLEDRQRTTDMEEPAASASLEDRLREALQNRPGLQPARDVPTREEVRSEPDPRRRRELAADRADAVIATEGSPARSAAGRLRNFRQMSRAKLVNTADDMRGFDTDPEGVRAVHAELDRRISDGDATNREETRAYTASLQNLEIAHSSLFAGAEDAPGRDYLHGETEIEDLSVEQLREIQNAHLNFDEATGQQQPNTERDPRYELANAEMRRRGEASMAAASLEARLSDAITGAGSGTATTSPNAGAGATPGTPTPQNSRTREGGAARGVDAWPVRSVGLLGGLERPRMQDDAALLFIGVAEIVERDNAVRADADLTIRRLNDRIVTANRTVASRLNLQNVEALLRDEGISNEAIIEAKANTRGLTPANLTSGRRARGTSIADVQGTAETPQGNPPTSISSPARSSQGRIRNLSAMRDSTLRETAEAMTPYAASDPDGFQAVQAELSTRGITPGASPDATAATEAAPTPSNASPSGQRAHEFVQAVGAYSLRNTLSVVENPRGRYARIQTTRQADGSTGSPRTIAYVRSGASGGGQLSLTRGAEDELTEAGIDITTRGSDGIGVRGTHLPLPSDAAIAARALEVAVGSDNAGGSSSTPAPSVQQEPTEYTINYDSAQNLAQDIISYADAQLPGDETSGLEVRTPPSGQYARVVSPDGDTIAYIRPGTGSYYSRSHTHVITFTRGSDQLGDPLPSSSSHAASLRNGQSRRIRVARGTSWANNEEEMAEQGREQYRHAARALLLGRSGLPRQADRAASPRRRRGPPRHTGGAGASTNPTTIAPGIAALDADTVAPSIGDTVEGRVFGFEDEIKLRGSTRAAIGTRSTSIAALDAAGVPVYPEHLDYGGWRSRSGGRVTDNRLFRSTNDNTAPGGPEIVSPPLVGAEGDALLKKVIEALNDAGAKQGPQSSHGLHVHVDVRDLTDTQKQAILETYRTNGEVIDDLVNPKRRTRHWAGGPSRTISAGHSSALNTQHMNGARGTIEIRRLGSTTDTDLIYAWTYLARALVVNAKKNGTPIPPMNSLGALLDYLDAEITDPEVKRILTERAAAVAAMTP